MNILFDNFLPNGPLPNLLDSSKFIDVFKAQKDIFKFIGKRGDFYETHEVGMGIPTTIKYWYDTKRINIIPSYFCNSLDSWFYPVDFLNPSYFGYNLLNSLKPFNLDSYLPEQILNGLQNKNGFLLLFFDGEIVNSKLINIFLQNTSIPKNKIIIFSKTTLDCNNFIFSIYNEILSLDRYINYNIKNKTKKYVCCNTAFGQDNRKYLKFRALVSALLLNNNFTENAVLSLGKEKNLYDFLEETNDKFNIELTNKILSEKKDILKIPEWVTESEVASAYFNITLDSYFLPENKNNLRQLYITEKIYIPMCYKQFYILFGRPHTLKFMKSIGYKTFNTIIDESYDNELDNEKRFVMAYKEARKICALNLDQIEKLYQKVEPIVEYNYNLIQKKIDQTYERLKENVKISAT